MGTNLRNAENYNIGLDIGTGSVGWAVTNENGELYYFKKKPTWGSRLFPSASTASDARTHRSQRRRYARRRWRLNLLQEIFNPQMNEVDPDFFIRLNQSRLLKEDRAEGHSQYQWPLFNNSDFTERDYYKKFPTIYHLRCWLMETPEKADLRLIYLALHNIVKTRGNFLHQDNPQLSAKTASMHEAAEELCEALAIWSEVVDIPISADCSEIESIFNDGVLKRAAKRDALLNALNIDPADKKLAKEIAGAVLGYKVDFSFIFNIEGEAAKFALDSDDNIEEFYSICPDEGLGLFEALQKVYSSYILTGILKGANGQTISYCKVCEYERYKRDLCTLKDLVREYAPNQYNAFFRGSHYDDPRWSKDYDPTKVSGYTLYNLGTSKRSYEDFKKDVKKLFSGTEATADSRYSAMMASFDENTFLRRLKTSDNGVIPYQLHHEEMVSILRNQAKHYPFLEAEADKIESLVTFRIPYYVGPLTTKNAARKGDPETGEMRFAWSERISGKENEKIYPWNWDEIIDKNKSAEHFIRRMTGDCTYLKGEPVLPRNSLLYERFCVLNELNGATYTCDGDRWHRFSFGDRADIVDELFKRGSVSYKKVEDWLSQHNRGRCKVKGGQGESKFESKLSSHIFFCDLLELDDIEGSTFDMVEEIILWSTLFEDRSILKSKIKTKYSDVLSENQIAKICKKRFSGWGRLSKKFLCELKSETANGRMSIMDILEDGNPEGSHVGEPLVLMQIIRDQHFDFQKLIDKHNLEKAKAAGGLSVDELPGSPALRRSVNQAIRIVKEIESIAGKPPANIFIEVTRDDDKRKKGKRSTRRYDSLKEALENLKAEGADALEDLTKRMPDDLDDALSLYFMQNAKCMYCGKPLDINHVIAHDHSYQIDHIIPQMYVKDDSFENRVLVHTGCNQSKADNLLIDPAIRRKMHGFWHALKDAGLIKEKKYNNLTRSAIGDKQLQGFINRQIVETSQIVKFVSMILQEKYPNANVKTVKASLSHQLREERGFIKSREANDFHHAHDALLASEIGRFIQLRHSYVYDNPIKAASVMKSFIRNKSEEYKKTHKMPGSATFLIESFLTTGFDKDTGEITKDTWNAEAECVKLQKYFSYKQCYISRMPEITTGPFWDATIYSPKCNKKDLSIALKEGLDPKKYGSYSSKKFAYFFLFSATDKKGKTKVFFEGLPVNKAAEIKQGDLSLLQYADELIAGEYDSPKILRAQINKLQLIEYCGDRFRIPALKEVYPARELCLSSNGLATIATIENNLSSNKIKAISQESILKLYREIRAKLPKLCSRRKEISNRLANNESAFLQASLEDQEKLVLNLAQLANGQIRVIDLRLVGGASTAGVIKSGFIKNDISNVVFIDQSVTGMFEKRETIEL